ncbi:peptide deformylase [Serpentinicella sp. ANB-PHB4]|uniref:peptide deformylase n=1 Tax=Serpentinicella sp. ANB-PHB4 TaxID=3074076 RepID=UPI00286156C8|nr:peptide deformylase [Serpentinicella sp. ANB-PHB4]MDR5658324.1 peptide deformylase [Serpentinicella sp. ANB-PHB4]
MAIRIIRTDDDPILRKKSKPVEIIDKRILTLLDDMKETMYDADGVGLAAPQIGILKRIIVIDVGYGAVELINPEIIDSFGEQSDTEGCLSLPGKSAEVIRPQKVTVKGLNRKNEEVTLEGEDLFARAICHEIDHLNGILFIDKAKK